MEIKQIKGNLIELALDSKFDVIVHGCNCFCKQKSGIAKEMVKVFKTDTFPKENENLIGDINKLGTIDYHGFYLNTKKQPEIFLKGWVHVDVEVYVVNAYTQYMYAKNHSDGVDKPLDYEAFTLCMRKINKIFKGKHIGLPGLIGCGLAGGDEVKVLRIIKQELSECEVTIVYLK